MHVVRFVRHFRSVALMIAAIALLLPQVISADSGNDYGGYRPHYQGDAVNTSGGRGGTVYRVTNLNDSGAGSLRAALEASGPRFVIFETSGTIYLTYPIEVTSPYLTVAGQTAPSPGITVARHPLVIDTHDVVLQHLRLRLGDQGYSEPGASHTIYIRENIWNVVLDHLSISWGMSTQVGINAWTGAQWKNVAMLDSIVAYGLRKSYMETGGGATMQASSGAKVTFARNLFVHNSHRQPGMAMGTRNSMINNVIYGSGNSFGDQTSLYGFMMIYTQMGWFASDWETGSRWIVEAAIRNNVMIGSYGTGGSGTEGTHPSTKAVEINMSPRQAASQGHKVFLQGNIGPYMTMSNQWAGVNFVDGGNQAQLDSVTMPAWHQAFNFEVIPSDQVEERVLANAGARPMDRDYVDNKAVEDTRTRSGSRITSQNDMGGFPNLARNNRSLTLPSNPNSVAPGQAFRTNIEVWLEGFAKSVEAGSLSAPANLRLSRQ